MRLPRAPFARTPHAFQRMCTKSDACLHNRQQGTPPHELVLSQPPSALPAKWSSLFSARCRPLSLRGSRAWAPAHQGVFEREQVQRCGAQRRHAQPAVTSRPSAATLPCPASFTPTSVGLSTGVPGLALGPTCKHGQIRGQSVAGAHTAGSRKGGGEWPQKQRCSSGSAGGTLGRTPRWPPSVMSATSPVSSEQRGGEAPLGKVEMSHGQGAAFNF